MNTKEHQRSDDDMTDRRLADSRGKRGAAAVRRRTSCGARSLVKAFEETLETEQDGPLQMSDVYVQLRRIAASLFQSERRDHTLQPTALANEAYLRLAATGRKRWDSRAHFFGAAARAMKRVLIDHARRARALRRGGAFTRVELTADITLSPSHPEEFLAVAQAIERLTRIDSRQGRVVELRFYAGLTIDEITEILGVRRTTVKLDWARARHWLRRELTSAS